MIDLSPLPSRQLQLFARLARWSLGLVVAFWLLVAVVWGALHGFIVPRIGEWRVQVERMATQSLGVPVHIASIQGQSDGLFPTITLSGVSVHDPQGRQALTLPSVVVTVSARSVLRWGLEQLYIEAPELDVRHLADGRWQIAGLEMVQSDDSQSTALDWLLEQPEVVIHRGTLRLTDEQRSAKRLDLHEVDIVLRNQHWSHVVRLDASTHIPSTERLQIIGAFRSPLLAASQGTWLNWSGQWYASAHWHALPHLPWLADWGVAQAQGSGQTRLWADVEKGHVVGVTADLALPQAQIRWLRHDVKDFHVQQLQGRVHAIRYDQSWWLEGQNFAFTQADGSAWPASNWSVSSQTKAAHTDSVELRLDFADMDMAAKVVQSLPLPAEWIQPVQDWQPRGGLRDLHVHWQANGHYRVSGNVVGLSVQPAAAVQGVGRPGLDGLDVAFEANERGGHAQLQMHGGTLFFPGVFDDPVLPLKQLQAQLRWSLEDGRLKVQVPKAEFANADAQGNLQGWWQMGAEPAQRLPGTLHLEGRLSRADGARVHRYLPLQVPELAREYVRSSVQQGQGRDVEFEVKGDLQHMPFDQPGTGRFYIKAPVQGVTYAFVPPQLQRGQALQWPALNNLRGTLIFEGNSMTVQQAQTGFVGHPQLRVQQVTAHIPDMTAPTVKVQAQTSTDLAAILTMVRQSPLASYTSHALDEAQAKGSASLAFDLELPIDQLQRSKVQGSVGFRKAELQFNQDTPWLHQLQGDVRFSEQGFGLESVHAHTLGGKVQIFGGMPSVDGGVHIQASGSTTAQGLQQDGGIALLQQIAHQAKGSTDYTLEIRAHEGVQQVTVRSDLKGMSLQLPAPFNKPSQAQWPLLVQQTLEDGVEQTWQVHVPELVKVMYVQTMRAGSKQDISGYVLIGKTQHPPTLGTGVSAQLHLDTLEMDPWLAWWSEQTQAIDSNAAMQDYLPRRVTVDISRLRVKERQLTSVQAQFQSSQGIWQGQLQARQFAGHVEYRTPSVHSDSGRIFARLSHLSIPHAEVQRLSDAPDVELLQQPNHLPALDIEVQQLDIAGKSLGSLQLHARNVQGKFGRDWVLERFNLSTPEAHWQANGTWASSAHGQPRQTQLGFLLEIHSSGQLLERLGLGGVIHDGQGRLSGHLAWNGAPISPDWRTMDGGVHMQLAQGQFLKVEPGMGKLLSVLSLQSLPRRINLDFRDVFSQGFAFDFVRGDVDVKAGVAHTNNLQMKGLNAAVLMQGQASLVHETQDFTVVVVPEINAMTASLAATAINPVVGLGSFLAQMFLRGPLMEAATRTFRVHGTWSDPVVDQVNKPRLAPLDNER